MMRIGIDFDNTIVSYDTLFHKVAVEQGAVPQGTSPTKLAVRDHLRAIGREEVWTEMQGYVYGARMEEATAYPGVLEFLRWGRDRGLALSVISHKTRYPFLGPQYDLHEAARNWVSSHLKDTGGPLVPPESVFFELTKEEKVRRIEAVACDYYVDDLPEILLASDFPAGTGRILFDPEAHHERSGSIVHARSWVEILSYFRRLCPKAR